jgi:hypothetical protein
MRISKWLWVGIFTMLAAGCTDSHDSIVVPPLSNADFFAGTWLTDTPATGVPQLVIRNDGGQLFVHGYGDCTPTFCDWGEVSTSIDDAAAGSITVIWDFSFKTTQIVLTRVDANHVHASVFHDYTVADGRTDRTDQGDFHRQ